MDLPIASHSYQTITANIFRVLKKTLPSCRVSDNHRSIHFQSSPGSSCSSAPSARWRKQIINSNPITKETQQWNSITEHYQWQQWILVLLDANPTFETTDDADYRAEPASLALLMVFTLIWIHMNNCMFSFTSHVSGVPHSSPLGPVLFF